MISERNYEMSIAINYDFLINIIVECVLCLVINSGWEIAS